MTDRETLIALLTRAGIPWTEGPYAGSAHLPAVTTLRVEAHGPIAGLPADAHPHRRAVFGYTGFYTDFYFDATGALVNMGAYE